MANVLSVSLTKRTCPSEESLRALLVGECAPDDQSRLTEHLDSCVDCQQALANVAGAPLDKVAGTLRVPSTNPSPLGRGWLPAEQPGEGMPTPNPSSALLHLIEQLKSEPPTTRSGETSNPTDGGDPVPLDFLSPADDLSYLGRLGRYLVLAEVGRGASGIVLKARDERLDRIVALKVLSPRLATNEHARRRFVREAKAAAAIRDDHVIGIHHVEEVNGLPFLVMEFIVGRSLAERMAADGPLPVPDILRIGSQIARGLAAAHAQGLVHRDIKPANILLENGVERVKITDFGLAHAVDDVRTTQPGTVLGTPEYMSPEQARGERVDHRSDLFSLGCVLYAMCAGRPPFRADTTVAILRRLCEDTPRPLSEINEGIPAWLAAFIDKLIAKNATDRFQSAAEVAAALEQCLAHVQQRRVGVPPAVPGRIGVPPVIAEPGGRGFRRAVSDDKNPMSDASSRTQHSVLSTEYPVPGTPVANPKYSALRARVPGVERSSTPVWFRPWAIAAGILLLLGAGLSVAETTGLTTVASSIIRIVRGDGTLIIEVDDPNIQVLLDGDEIAITGAGPKELRLRPGQHQLHTVHNGQPSETKLITITKGGRDVVKISRENSATTAAGVGVQLFSVPIDDQTGKARSKPTVVADCGELWIHSTALPSPDGQWIAGSSSDVFVSRLDGSEHRFLSTGIFSNELRVCGWFPDGKSLLVYGATAQTGGKNAHFRVDIATGASQLLYGPNEGAGAGRLSPDGTRHAFAIRGNLYVRAIEPTAKPKLIHAAEDEASTVPGWSPDGKRIAFFASKRSDDTQHRLMIIPAGGGEPKEIVSSGQHYTSNGFPGSPIWSPDNKFIAYSSCRPDGTSNGIWLVRPTGGEPIYLDVGANQVFNFFWSLDSQSLFFLGSHVVKVSREQPQPQGVVNRLVWDNAPSCEGCPISPDGSLIAFADESGDLAVREVETGQIRRLTTDGTWKGKARAESTGETAAYPTFSPDGTLLSYWWRSLEKRTFELRVIDVAGGTPRTVYRSSEDVLFSWMAGGCTRDNRWRLAALHKDEGKTLQLVLIPLDGGSTKPVTSFPINGAYVWGMLSPNGDTIALCRTSSTNPPNKDLLLIDVATGKETPIPTHGPDSGPHAWTRDGKALIYETGTSGASSDAGDLCVLRIVDGKPHGEPKVVHADFLQLGVSQGITNDGTLYYGTYSGGPRRGGTETHIYTAALDLKNGTAAATPLAAEKLSTRYDYYMPVWSPDGEQLAYKVVGRNNDYDIKIISLKGLGPRAIKPTVAPPNTSRHALQWSPDAKSFVVTTSEQQSKRSGIYRIDVESGRASTIIEAPQESSGRRSVASGQWAADGHGVFYVKNANVIALHDFESGTDTEILADNTMALIYGIRLSPDGRRLALTGLEKDPKAVVLRVVDVDGKTSRDLLRSVWQNPPKHATGPTLALWTPDGRNLVFLQRPTENADKGPWFISVDGGDARKLEFIGIDATAIENMSMHPKEDRLVLTTAEPRKYQIWALENFLPPQGDPKPAAAATATNTNKPTTNP